LTKNLADNLISLDGRATPQKIIEIKRIHVPPIKILINSPHQFHFWNISKLCHQIGWCVEQFSRRTPLSKPFKMMEYKQLDQNH
jgi:hypothetical protein